LQKKKKGKKTLEQEHLIKEKKIHTKETSQS